MNHTHPVGGMPGWQQQAGARVLKLLLPVCADERGGACVCVFCECACVCARSLQQACQPATAGHGRGLAQSGR